MVRHSDLSIAQVDALRALFDGEYRATHGEWDPDRPYGYSPADVHTMLLHGSTLIGHVGYQHRTIRVGSRGVSVAGTGGVLVHQNWRSEGVGRRVMRRAQESMRRDDRIAFGYLGCRDEVVPFYECTGWTRLSVTERHRSIVDPGVITVSTDGPILIYDVSGAPWPSGDVDLQGTPW